MTESNIKKTNEIVSKILDYLNTGLENLSVDRIDAAADAILKLEKAKDTTTPKMMNWGTCNIHQANGQGEISTTYTNGGKDYGNEWNN